MQVRNIAKTMVVGVAALASAAAFAGDDFDGFDFDGLYILGGVTYAGINDANFEDKDSHDHNFGGAFLADTDDLKAKGNIGWRGGLGAWLTDNFAVEFNYFGIGNMHSESGHESIDISIPELDELHITADGKQELHTKGFYSFDLSGLGRCYFTDNLWGFARLGVAYTSVTRELKAVGSFDITRGDDIPVDSGSGSADISEQKQGGMGAAIGIGAQYDFTEMFGLRAEASTIQALNNDDSYAIGLNLVVNFGELM
jgi:hypothetical protein